MSAPARSIAVMVVLLMLVGSLVSRLPTPDSARNRPFDIPAGLGQQVTLTTGVYEVISVEGAPSVKGSYASSGTSTGLFLVFTVWHAGIEEPSFVQDPSLIDSIGRRYGGGQELLLGTCRRGQPLLGQTCQVVIEVDPRWLPGARLMIAAEGFSDGRHDEVAAFDLAITQEQVTTWLSQPTVTLAEPHPGHP